MPSRCQLFTAQSDPKSLTQTLCSSSSKTYQWSPLSKNRANTLGLRTSERPQDSLRPPPLNEGFQISSFTFLHLPSTPCPLATQNCPSAPDRHPGLFLPQVGVRCRVGETIGLSFSCTFVTGQSESLPCFIICPFHAPSLLSSSHTLAPSLTRLVRVVKYAHVLGEDAMLCSVCMFLICINAINIVCLFHSILF